MADLGRVPPLFWVKKEEMTEGKMAGRASKSRPHSPLPLSSRSGSATGPNRRNEAAAFSNSLALSG